MNVARSTVQGIYIEARKKLAESLVNGKVLSIEGGEYRLCDGLGNGCGRGCHVGIGVVDALQMMRTEVDDYIFRKSN